MPSPKIDSHHHLWKYTKEDYGWMGAGMEGIRRDFLPADLKKALHDGGLDGAIAVQARQSLEETDWLLKFAEANSFMRGVVGWVPLVEATVERDLAKYAGRKKLKGIRHVLHDEADDFYMLRVDFNAGISKLKRFGLVYDILIFEKHLLQTLKFVDMHPNQVFVVDHLAKPRIKDHVMSPWKENMAQLAKRPNVYCKISGMVTEADWKNWIDADLRPYIDSVLESFGPKRCMFGSDWPVMLVASDYKRWVDVVQHAISGLSKAEQERVMGGTAVEAYKL